ncbi:MAG: methyltransferase domain-containing protein [Rhodospirillaceae bacterium]|nr:methyltransferase domain-containing protein [Rhodospirillaceae bacterium]MBT7512182.1 methyltransferase domain-containing protein [Rhodospirillaceae bacterium]
MTEQPPDIDTLDDDGLRRVSQSTLGYYSGRAERFWEGTRDHDVSQNYAALLDAIEGEAPLTILDIGCGPGRDVQYFKSLGHDAMGLDGSETFVEMARAHTGCEILHQDFLALALPDRHFDGIFANATLFHVPSQELPRVLSELLAALKPSGVLFTSNPRGENEEGYREDRYCAFHDLEAWRGFVSDAGFAEIHHYYRPEGKPRAEQPWLATVWRKP